MERRVLLAIFLAFLVLYTWQALFVKPVPKPATGAATNPSPVTAPVDPVGGSAAASPAAADQPAVAPKSSVALAPALVAETSEREVRVETRDIIATFTNKGARLKRWRLKHYLDQQKQPQELIEHLPSQPLPFTLRAGSDTTTTTLNEGLYKVSGAPDNPSQPTPIDLRFEYRDSAGVQAVKEFHLDPASYIFTFRASIAENDTPVTPSV